MESKLEMQMKRLRSMGRKDETYRTIEKEFRKLEKDLEKMAATLSEEQQDVLWAYICTSDALDHRLLEIACAYIRWQEFS